MFSKGTRQLIDALPALDGLEANWARRRLSEAYLDVLAAHELIGGPEHEAVSGDLRRLTNALELYVLERPLHDEHVAACAFVAAEALELRIEAVPVEVRPEIRVEAGLLFVVAGFDANAAAVAGVPDPEDTAPRAWALSVVAAMLRQAQHDAQPSDFDPPARSDVIAGALWREIGRSVQSHQTWLRGSGEAEESPGRIALETLGEALRGTRLGNVQYATAAHFIALTVRALQATEARALRRFARLDSMRSYIEDTLPRRPLLWPGADRFASQCLENLDQHTAVALPTGSGKSAIAELAAIRGMSEGWCVYLAPTNALVGQIRRDLRPVVERAGGQFRSFVGGGEYTSQETIEEVGAGDLFAMTPERCALALRQSPEVFSRLRVLIVDECHLIGSGGTRGVLAELVVAEILARSENVTVVLMSALVSNAGELSDWLRAATGRDAISIDLPWRPTRTLRGIVGMDAHAFNAARSASESALSASPHRVYRPAVQLMAMVGLQGAWDDTDKPEDFVLVNLPAEVEAQFRTTDRAGDVAGWRNRAAEALSLSLARAGEHVLTFVPANKHEVFSVGRAVAEEMESVDLDDAIVRYLDLAEYELGRSSQVRELLEHGVATHSGALIDEERRASEIAFSARPPMAPVMVATTSLAQGLNLPATVVVIAGTRIGPTQQGSTRTARDLLNAIGRAGRPFVTNRSLALVVPSEFGLIASSASATTVLRDAPFIGREDAADPLESQLLALLRRDPQQLASLDAMTPEELTAFTYLPLRGEAGTAGQILRNTLGHFQRGNHIRPTPEETIAALTTLGESFLAASETPPWLVDVAHLSGMDLRAVGGLFHRVVATPRAPGDVVGWADALLEWTSGLGAATRDLLCDLSNVPDPLGRNLRYDRPEAWASLNAATRSYLRGDSLADLAAVAFGVSRDDGRRSSGDPLPKAVGLVRDLFIYRLSMAAGALQALFAAAAGRDDAEAFQLPPESASALADLPLSLRLGCANDDARAWSRYGVHRRRLAHLLAAIRPVPEGLAGESAIRAWMRSTLADLVEDDDLILELDDPERRAILAAVAGVS